MRYSFIFSALLLSSAIIMLPAQFLFSKTVPASFWTAYFPLPFGAGWLISFVLLIPALWLSPWRKTLIGALPMVSALIVCATPLAMLCNDYPLTLNNLLGQYIWLVIICLPPCLVHLILRCALLLRKSQPN